MMYFAVTLWAKFPSIFLVKKGEEEDFSLKDVFTSTDVRDKWKSLIFETESASQD